MEKMARKRILLLAAPLLAFGLFYALREQFFRSYLSAAESAGAQDRSGAALSDFMFADALDESGRQAELRLRRADIYLGLGETASAESELRAALASSPEKVEALARLARVLHAEGRYAAAEEIYVRLFSVSPTPENFSARLRNQVSAGDLAGADELIAAEQSGALAEDAAYFARLLALNRGSYPLAQSGSLPASGKYAQQLALVQEFVNSGGPGASSNPDYLLVQKADLFNRLGETDFAQFDLGIVLARNQRYRDAYLVQGQSLLIAGRYGEAADALEKCLALDADDSDTLLLLVEAYSGKGDDDRAAAYRQRYEALIK